MEPTINKLIIFDFNRTLYDPDHRALLPGATQLLQFAKEKAYKLILVGQAADSREQLIADLGLTGYMEEIILVDAKTAKLFNDIADRYLADKPSSFVVGDRAQREITLGHKTGWRTIWLQAGKFADEHPAANHLPTHTVTALNQIQSFL